MAENKKDYVSWDASKNEAKRIGISAWTQWYHKPYECDWREARIKAIDRKWKLIDD